MLKVGFIGLGTMGFPIAGHISKSYKTLIFNRTIKKSQKWASKFEGEVCESVKDIALKSNVIFLCLSEDKDIEEIILGSAGILEYLNEGTIVIDHSTTSIDIANVISKELFKKDSFYQWRKMSFCFLRTMNTVSPSSGIFDKTNIHVQKPLTLSLSIKL